MTDKTPENNIQEAIYNSGLADQQKSKQIADAIIAYCDANYVNKDYLKRTPNNWFPLIIFITGCLIAGLSEKPTAAPLIMIGAVWGGINFIRGILRNRKG